MHTTGPESAISPYGQHAAPFHGSIRRVGARTKQRSGRGYIASRWLAVLPVLMLAVAATVLEMWKQPPTWLLSARHTDVYALHWLRTHLLTTAGITAAATVATA